jgi:NAD(P)H-dependent flavin oxidoreductase YrpB (nitropropane dioxygenase family)
VQNGGVDRLHTPFSDLVGCAWPVQLAGMGGAVGGPALALAVQTAGGLGMISFGEELPDRRCGVNVLWPFRPPPEALEEMAGRTHIVEFFYGPPDDVTVELVHGAGALAGWQVGSVDEALQAARAGCDYLVAQGTEAGGHVRGTQPLDAVLAEVVERVDLPVVAAGGIATAERVAELFTRGAHGVRVGTRFLACTESNAHEDYVADLLAAGADDTVLTEWFDEGWPDAPHRVLRPALEAAMAANRHSPSPPSRSETKGVAAMAQYAGTGVGSVTCVESAAAVVADLVRLVR